MSSSGNISISGLADTWALVLLFSFVLSPFAFAENHSGTEVGSEASPSPCSKCHAQIVASYAKTAMAHASGLASVDPIQGDFFHHASGVDYRVEKQGDGLWLRFDRRGAPPLHGKREFIYYIGSGKLKGRTYLFAVDQFLFESPINWYAQSHLWDMTPNYQQVTEATLNLPVLPECLNCHASRVRLPKPGTQNLYPESPFAHGGVSCERCHGPSLDHALHGAKMMSIDRLPAERRDAICMQCHLEGNATVERPHRHVYDFAPGDDLSEFARYFVLTSNTGGRGVGQFEAIAQSRCKRESGDKMTCTTCHDPHRQPEDAEAPAYFRQKCISCHGEAFAIRHHPENQNCVACHMPAEATVDVNHTQVTDHRILREPSRTGTQLTNSASLELQPFPSNSRTKADVRDLALAYESLVQSGNRELAAKAETLLTRADQLDPTDAPVATALGYIAQEKGDLNAAVKYYEQVLHSGENTDEASNNLAVIEAGKGHLQRAVSLWQGVFKDAPWRSNVGINIALAFCAANRYEIAREYLLRVQEFNPDSSAARTLMNHLSSEHPACSIQ